MTHRTPSAHESGQFPALPSGEALRTLAKQHNLEQAEIDSLNEDELRVWLYNQFRPTVGSVSAYP